MGNANSDAKVRYQPVRYCGLEHLAARALGIYRAGYVSLLSSRALSPFISYLPQLRENPEQYCEDLLHSLKIADKRTYFAALPADIEHLARRYALRNDVFA